MKAYAYRALIFVCVSFLVSCSVHTGSQITIRDYASDKAQVNPPNAIEQKEVSKIVEKRISRIAGCYDHTLRYERRLKANLLIEWDVTKEGKVIKAKVKSSEYEGEKNEESKARKYLESCVLKQVEQLKFDGHEIEEGINIIYPVVFVLDEGLD